MASTSESKAIEPQTRDSLSSVSTTSLVFERLHEENEKRQDDARSSDGFEDDDPLKEEEDLETGPFLGTQGPARIQPMDKKCRRVIMIVGGVLLLVWLSALGIGIATGLHKHANNKEHDPEEQKAWGSKKQVTMDQVFSGFWSAKSRSIDWIQSPEGKDGLLIETNTAGKDYIIVRDVRSDEKKGREADQSGVASEKTLMKDNNFFYGGDNYSPMWSAPSADLKKVLLGVNRKSNWRHSFTAIYFILDVESQKVEPLIPDQAEARIQYAVWSPTSDAIAYVQDNNLFVRKLDEKKSILQVSEDGGPEYFYGIPDWVYEEEVLQDRGATWWSEDGKYLSFFRTNETGVPEFPIQYFIQRPSGKEPAEGEENYPEVRQIKYPKAGSHNPVVDLMFYDVGKEEKFSVDISDEFKDDNRILNNVLWAGDKVLVKETNRISDIVKLIHIDVPNRKGKTIHTIDVDKIDGGWFEISHKMTYVPADPDNGRPHDGYVDVVVHENYNHLAYFSPLDATDPVMLTKGDWEVVDAPSAVDTKNNRVYFVATKKSPIERHVYSVKLDGTDFQPLTDTASMGYYTASFSANAGFVLLSYQGPKIPYQKVISTPSFSGSYDKTLEDNAELADRAKSHDLPLKEYGTIDIGDGITLNYVERRPRNFNPKKQYPVLFQQYSGPGSQTVTRKFAVDFQSYVAASLGYLCITVDPRGTGYMGRKHRVAVRGNIGQLEAHDHILAAQHFAKKKYVDASRLAIWGWSYGGFTTLKTLEMDAGKTYSYGMAVAPVTDWRFYDSVYTERYMRLPSENQEGYDSTKVANATALGENVRFLMMHGVADDNVHFQNTLVLLDDLDLAGVENYDVHVFSDSDHSIYFHNANRIVYDKLRDWLVNAFNGEWLKIVDPVPKELTTKGGKRLDRRDSEVLGPVLI